MKASILCASATVMVITASLPNVSGTLAQELPEKKARLAFEVATVRPSDPKARQEGVYPLPGGQTYVANGAPLRLMIMSSFELLNDQMVGGPEWMNTALFDVRAKAEKPSNLTQLHEMFQTLLVDRFKLQFHREPRPMSVYELTVASPGRLKLNPGTLPFAKLPIMRVGPNNSVGVQVSMSYLCVWLAREVNRPVVDKTGLDKYYDFSLEFRPEIPDGYVPPPGVELPPDGPSIFTALREQLGLKLESKKGTIDMFVIDKAEKPTEN